MHKTKKIRLGNKSALVTVLFVSGMGLIFVYVTLIYSSVVRFCWDVLRLIAQQPQKEDGLLISKFIGIGPAYVGGVDINRWIDAAFSIPEASGSQKIPPIGGFLNLLILFSFLCFVIYLVLVLQDTKREIREKQKRLKMLGYIYEVETLLFSTCLQDRSHCVQALERIAKMAGAQGAFLKLFVKTGADQVYVWCPEPEQERVFSAILEKNRFFVGAALNGMIRYDKQEATEASISTRRRSLLSDANLSNFAEVVVKDAQGECIGMLGVFNAESKNPDMRAALENVTHSFGIWYEN